LLAQVPFDLKYVKNTEFVCAMIHRTNPLHPKALTKPKKVASKVSGGGNSVDAEGNEVQEEAEEVVEEKKTKKESPEISHRTLESIDSSGSTSGRCDAEFLRPDSVDEASSTGERPPNEKLKVVTLNDYLHGVFTPLDTTAKLLSVGLEDVRRLKRSVTHPCVCHSSVFNDVRVSFILHICGTWHTFRSAAVSPANCPRMCTARGCSRHAYSCAPGDDVIPKTRRTRTLKRHGL
jgi:hypothetical protein